MACSQFDTGGVVVTQNTAGLRSTVYCAVIVTLEVL